MIIRKYKVDDEDAIQELAKKYNLSVPDYGEMLVAEDESGKIIGFINLRMVMMIEPMVCDNPIAATKLFEEAVLHMKIKKVPVARAYINESMLHLSERVDLVEVFQDHKIVEKIIEPLNDQEILKLRERNLLKNTNIN